MTTGTILRSSMILVLVLGGFCIAPLVLSAPLAIGDVAPDFDLPGSDGERHRLFDYRGKFVVLAWFPKAFTGG
jgi:peroxiredoxin Q/BCP